MSDALNMLKSGTATSQWLEDEKTRRAGRVGSVLSYDDRDPDTVAENMRLGKALNVPSVMVDAAPNVYARQEAQQKASQALASAPVTAKWLSDRQNAGLAKDDVESLSWFEQNPVTGGVSRATSRAEKRARSGLAYSSATITADMIADFGKTEDDLIAEELAKVPDGGPAIRTRAIDDGRRRYLQIKDLTQEDVEQALERGAYDLLRAQELRQAAAEVEYSEAGAGWRDGALANADNSIAGFFDAVIEDPKGAAAFIAEVSAESLLPLAAATAATAATRSPTVGAAVMGGNSFLVENSETALSFLQEQGVAIDTPEAAAAVLSNPEIMAEAREKGFDRGLVIALFDAMSGGVAGQRLARSTMGEVFAQGVVQVTLAAGGETVGQMAAGQELDYREIALEGVADLVTAPFEVVGIGRRFARDMAKASTGDAVAQEIDAIDKVAAESKLKKRSPEDFKALLDAQGGDSFYLPADDLREFFQAKDVPDQEMLDAWGIDPETFAEAEATGLDVPVSRAAYATYISGTEDAEWFKSHAVTSPDQMSASQAQRFNEEWREASQQAFDEAAEAMRADMLNRASDVQVYDQMYSQLRSAGRTVDVAQNEAKVWQSFWRTMGERYGEDPLDLARSMGVVVRGPDAPQLPRKRADIDIALNRLRSGKPVKAEGDDLLGFVRSLGGVQDTGGEVASMDPPKGVIGETAEEGKARANEPDFSGKIAKGKGVPLDQLGRQAIEAGYFPQYMGGADIQPDGTVVDEAALMLDALQRAIAGEDIRVSGMEADQSLLTLAEEIDRRGFDLKKMSNDEVVAALGQTFEQEARGSITFPRGGLSDGETVINLFENADLSTLLHESGHFFLEAFTALAQSDDAPQAMQEDLVTIREFLGADGEFKTEHHEKWARGFEQYVMEGKAPSLALSDAFARFKAWLTRIYRTAKGLNVKITPEVREVMDRMLATDAEIAEARNELNMSPLFTDQGVSGMSDGAWSTYQRMARRSAEQAEQSLLEKTMAKVRREKEAWWKQERATVKEQVSTEINSRREFRLVEFMANGQWIGSNKDVPDMRISRKSLVDMFGEGALAEVSQKRVGGKRAIYAKEGISVYEAADFFGFADPSEMFEALRNAGKRKEAIEVETDRVMLDRYGDPLNDGTIEQEAMEAIHSDQQAKTVASEVRHLAGRVGRPTRNLTAKIFRQRARSMLGRMATREATKPDAFLAAERRAAKRAEDAFAKVARGNSDALAAAAGYKEQQLLNHYLYLEARDLKKVVDAKREKMRAYGKKSVREKLDGGYIEQIDALLDQYDFRVRSARQVARDESLREFVQRMESEGRAGELAIDPALMERAERVHYSTLSVDELRGLFDTIENIDHLGRHKKKLLDAREKRDLDKIVSDIEAQFAENVSGNPPGRTQSPSEARRKLGRDYLNTVLNADTLLREVDGFADLGPTWTAMKSKVDQGMSRLVERRQEMAKSFDEIYSAYSGKEKRAMAKKEDIPELGAAMSKWDLIALALNTGNEDNFQRLTNEKVKGSFTREQIEKALERLDKRDWETVQKVWDYIDSFWPEIEAKEKRQTGIAPEKVQARVMIEGAPGFVKGGYYPIKYDARLSGLTDSFRQQELAETLMGGRFGKAQTRNGHTKERASSSRQPINLDLSVAHSHVEQVIYDLEIGEAVTGSWKILQDPRVKSAFYEKGKQSDFDALELWLQDVAAGERIAAGGLQTILRHVRSGFVISRLALNLSTALIQPSGLVQSAVVVGKRAVALGTASYISNIPRWVSEVSSVSPMMRERQITFERDIFNVVGDLEGGPVSGWRKFQRDVVLPLSFLMMQKVQFYTVDMPTWVSAYQKEVKKSGDEAKAREYADLMVRRAQGSGLMSDRGMLERGTVNKSSRQQEFPRMLTALGSYMFAKGNVAYERTRETNFKDPVEVFKLAADIGLLFTLEAVLYSAVKGFLPEEDEAWSAWLAKETAFGMMSSLPYTREVSGAMQGFGGGGIFGSGVEAVAKPFIQAEQGEFDKAFVKSGIDFGAIMFHLPSTQVKAGVEAFFDDDMGLRRNPNAVEALGLGTGRGRSIADLMFD